MENIKPDNLLRRIEEKDYTVPDRMRNDMWILVDMKKQNVVDKEEK